MFEKTATYFWDKVAILMFADLPMEDKIETARLHLGKDEFDHLMEIIKGDE